MTTHIAQLNIGRFRYPTDDPRMRTFMTNLDRVNALAERSEGFVWRLKDESDNATAIRPATDPTMAVNLSVWESVEALERFVWVTVHKQFYNRKGEWFEKLEAPHFVMWPIPSGHVPDLEEAMGRLAHLAAHGDSDFAFGWSHLAHIKLWMSLKNAADGWTDTMKIESEKHRMEVHRSDLVGSKKARLDRAIIDGIAVPDLFAYCRAGHGANGA